MSTRKNNQRDPEKKAVEQRQRCGNDVYTATEEKETLGKGLLQETGSGIRTPNITKPFSRSYPFMAV